MTILRNCLNNDHFAWLRKSCKKHCEWPLTGLTFRILRAYNPLHGAPPSRRDGAPQKLLTDTRWQSVRLPSAPGALMLFGISGGGIVEIPGCLTGESEERETWTAESLRAASLARDGGRTRLRRYTFQVNTMVSWVRDCLGDQSGTSSNVVISRFEFSSNLRV